MPTIDVPTRPVVYLLHGLLGTAYGHFGAQIAAWREKFLVVPVDLPGHGRCRLDASDAYADAAFEYVLALVRRFGPGRFVAASQLGGPIAVRCASEHPELVRSLVLTGFAPDLQHEVQLGLLAGFAGLAAQHPELATEYERLHGSRWKDTLQAFTDDVRRSFTTKFLVRHEDLGALRTDVYLVNGALKTVERAAAEHAAEFGPRVSGLVLDGAGHIASHDAAEEFTLAVERFWGQEEYR